MSTDVIGHRPYTNLVGTKRVYFDNLNLGRVNLRDIAQGLVHENRYSGQTFRPYSVLEHSLLCAEQYEVAERGKHAGIKLALLMHDAHEFLCKDMPSPLKKQIPGYRQFERRCELATWNRFGIEDLMTASFGIIHRVDLILLNTERHYFGFEESGDWPSYDTYPPSPTISAQLSWNTCELVRSLPATHGRMKDLWVASVVDAMSIYFNRSVEESNV